MNHFKAISIATLALMGLTASAYAGGVQALQTLHIKLQNHTNKTLTYTGVTNQQTNDTFQVTPTVIPANTTANIEATSQGAFGSIGGTLHFTTVDKSGHKINEAFVIVDQGNAKVSPTIDGFALFQAVQSKVVSFKDSQPMPKLLHRINADVVAVSA